MIKHYLITLFVSLLLLIPIVASALEISPTIRWAIDDTSNTKGYIIYYSPDYSMTGKKACGTINDITATQFKTPVINVEAYPVYFTVAAIQLDDTEIESMPYSLTDPNAISQSITIPTNLRVVQN